MKEIDPSVVQKVDALRASDKSISVSDACNQIGITTSWYYQLRKYGKARGSAKAKEMQSLLFPDAPKPVPESKPTETVVGVMLMGDSASVSAAMIKLLQEQRR